MSYNQLGLTSDTIACPGLDYYNSPRAHIAGAKEISNQFADLNWQHDIGELKIKISGCTNACATTMLDISAFWQRQKRHRVLSNLTRRLGRRNASLVILPVGLSPKTQLSMPLKRWSKLMSICARRRALYRHLSSCRAHTVQGTSLCRIAKTDY